MHSKPLLTFYFVKCTAKERTEHILFHKRVEAPFVKRIFVKQFVNQNQIFDNNKSYNW